LSRLAEVPPEIEALVKRALAKRPQDRPRSAEYMAAELAAFAASSARWPTAVPVTPSGVVLNSAPVFANLGLGTEWERPTVEISTQRRHTPSTNRTAPHRSMVSGHALGAAVVAGLTVGIAVLAFGAASKPATQLTASGTMQPLGQGAAVAEPASRVPSGSEPGSLFADPKVVPAVVGNPALALAPNAGAPLKLRPLKETKKAKKPRNPQAPADVDAVRLPPSGL
jgi:hypothetical protein